MQGQASILCRSQSVHLRPTYTPKSSLFPHPNRWGFFCPKLKNRRSHASGFFVPSFHPAHWLLAFGLFFCPKTLGPKSLAYDLGPKILGQITGPKSCPWIEGRSFPATIFASQIAGHSSAHSIPTLYSFCPPTFSCPDRRPYFLALQGHRNYFRSPIHRSVPKDRALPFLRNLGAFCANGSPSLSLPFAQGKGCTLLAALWEPRS